MDPSTRLMIEGHGVAKPGHLNRVAITGLVIAGLLFIIFLWFYISPLFDKTNSVAPVVPDVEGGPTPTIEESEKESLIAWMRRRSRGRFADTAGNNRPRSPPKVETCESRPSFFSRISIIPHITPSTPPPAYATQPTTPTREYQAAPTVSSPLGPGPRTVQSLSVPRLFIPVRRVPLHSNSTPTTPVRTRGPPEPSLLSPTTPTKTKTTLRPPAAPRSVSDSTLHPSWIARLPSPSRALVFDRENPGPNVTVRIPAGSPAVVASMGGRNVRGSGAIPF